MTRKILTLNMKRRIVAKPVEKIVKAVFHPDPEKRFLNGVAINPDQLIQLELGSKQHSMRAMDLLTPIGMGQRGLIVAPPGSGKTTILKHICQSVGEAYPEIKLYALLIDERPEEVTDFKRNVPAQVFASSTDENYDHHLRVTN
ncbi:MAG: transcription termination factor Rho, partial [Colwellia sp.]